MRRIGAVILRNKKILLVTGYDESFYWTPGGKANESEKDEDCLKRELKEELNINIEVKEEIFRNKCNKEENIFYRVEAKGKITPHGEITRLIFYGERDLNNNGFVLSKNTIKLLYNLISKKII